MKIEDELEAMNEDTDDTAYRLALVIEGLSQRYMEATDKVRPDAQAMAILNTSLDIVIAILSLPDEMKPDPFEETSEATQVPPQHPVQ